MNKILTLLMIFSCSMLHAQRYSLGIGGIYGDDIENVGLHFRSYYNLNEKICFGPEFSYFFTTSESIGSEEIERSLYEINLNGHYIFELSESWGIYPLVGLNLSVEDETITRNGEQEKEAVEVFGLNLGGGIHKSFNRTIVFAEYDHLLSDLSQSSWVVGLLFHIGDE